MVSALQNELSSFNLYPDGYATYLREAVANFLQVEEEQLIFGNGADNLIQIISRSFLLPGKIRLWQILLFHNISTMLLLKEQK